MRKIVFIGNCQSRRLQEFHQQYFAEIYDDQTEMLVSFADFTPEVARSLETADIVVSQLFDTEQRASVSMVDTAAEIIYWPSVTGAVLWPFSGVQHVHNRSLPYFGDGPYGLEWGDRWLNKKITDGLPPEEIVQQYMNLDVANLTKLDRVYDISMARAVERDRKTGFDLASVIASSLKDTPLFTSPAHFNLDLFFPLATGLYERLGIPRAEIDRVLRLQWRAPFPQRQQPIHPSIIKHFGLKYVSEDTRYRMATGEHLTYEEWCNRYVRFEWNDKLMRTLMLTQESTPEFETFDDRIDAVNEAVANSNGSDDAYVRLGSLFTQAGRPEEALAVKLKCIEFNPDDPDITLDLCHFLTDAGRIEESEQKINSVIERWPNYAEAWFRLACFYDRVGREDDFYRTLNHAIKMDPTNYYYLHFYGHVIRRFPLTQAMLQPFITAMNIRPYSMKLKELTIENLMHRKQWQRALAVLDEALRLQPGREDLIAQREEAALHLAPNLEAKVA